MKLPKLATFLTSGFPAFDEVAEVLEEEWTPESPPITVSMCELGRVLIEKAGNGFTEKDIGEIFLRVERILETGTESEKDSVATGFLEAVASAIDRSPQHQWVVSHIGPNAREYLSAWDEFCGKS